MIDKTQDPAPCPFCELVPDLVNGDCVYHPAIGHKETACPMDGHYFSLSAWNRRPSPASPAPQGAACTHGSDYDDGFCPRCELDRKPAPAPGADTREAAAERLLHDMAAYKTKLEAALAPVASPPADEKGTI